MEPVIIQGFERIMFAIYLGILPILTVQEQERLDEFNSLALIEI